MRTFTVKSLLVESPYIARKISIQTVIRKGIPTVKILGISNQKSLDLSIKLQTIFLCNHISLPYESIQTNISPSLIKNYPSYLDLSLFMSIYLSFNENPIFNENHIEEFLFLGELTLLGELETFNDITSLVVQGKQLGFNKFIIPKNAQNDFLEIENIEIAFISHIQEILNNSLNFIKKSNNNYIIVKPAANLQIPKKLLDVLPLIAGKHSIFFLEKQALNKVEILNTLKYFLPDITSKEKDAFLLVHKKIIPRPTIIIPNNTTKKELIGDKKSYVESILFKNQFGLIIIENINLSNKDLIFFYKSFLENQSINYYNFTLRNSFWNLFFSLPCPCGSHLISRNDCICSQKQIISFHQKFNLYLKDVIDVIYQIENEYITLSNNQILEIQEKIDYAVQIQIERFKDEDFLYNSEIPINLIETYCKFNDKETEEFWKEKTKHYNTNELKIIRKIAQTLADYSGNLRITKNDVELAIQFRNPINLFEEPRIYRHFTYPLE